MPAQCDTPLHSVDSSSNHMFVLLCIVMYMHVHVHVLALAWVLHACAWLASMHLTAAVATQRQKPAVLMYMVQQALTATELSYQWQHQYEGDVALVRQGLQSCHPE